MIHQFIGVLPHLDGSMPHKLRTCVYYTNTSLERVRIYTIIFHIMWLICELTSIHVYLANTIQVYSVTVNLWPMLKHFRPNNLARGHLSLLHRTLGCWVEPTQGHVSSLMAQFILSNVQQRRPKITSFIFIFKPPHPPNHPPVPNPRPHNNPYHTPFSTSGVPVGHLVAIFFIR